MTRETAHPPFGTPHRFVEVPPSRVATWRVGQGPDVVLVHGWPLHAATFRHLVPLLREHFTLHLVDLPGAGATACGAGQSFDMVSLARSLAATIDALGLSRYALIAHDSGGLVARLVAAEHGSRVAGLVLGNTEIPDHKSWLLSLFLLFARLPGGGPMFLSALRVGALRRSILGLGGCFSDPRYMDGEFRELFLEPLMRPGPTRDNALSVLRSFDLAAFRALRAAHPRITAPVRLVWGAEDPFFPLEGARAMVSSFPSGADLVVLPGAKLFAHEDHPAELAAPTIEALTRWFAPRE
jgi:haloalkane dehalogenase